MSDTQFGAIIGLHTLGYALAITFFVTARYYLRNAAEILEMAKAYYEMGRNQHKDASRVMEKVEKRSDADSVPAPEIMSAIETVPKKTADAVVQKLDEKSSESHTHLPAVHPADSAGGSL